MIDCRIRGPGAAPRAPVARAALLLISLLLGVGCDCRGTSTGQDAGQSDSSEGDGGTDGGQDGGAVQACLSTNPGSYAGALMESQTGAFEIGFEVTPQASPVEAGVALSHGTLTGLAWTDNAAIVRFNLTGTIDARNGDLYQALVSRPYVAGATYRIREVVDVARHAYSIFVTPPDGSEVLLGDKNAFRTNQQSVTSLDQWGIITDSGSLRVCLVSLRPLPASVSVTVAPPSVSVKVNATQQFSSAVTGTANTAVNWSVDEPSGCGSVTSAGLYAAPGAVTTCHVTATSAADNTKSATAVVTLVPATPTGQYPFHGYTTTRGAFAAATTPRILIVDRLTASSSDGDATTGRGSLPWALARSFPRVIVFEVSGTIDVGGSVAVVSPYVSVHGQTAPSPGITLYNVELVILTHDVIFQHVRARMGGTSMIGGGDSMGVGGVAGETVSDIIIDHCSAEFGHDEQLSISNWGRGPVRRVTLSNNLVALGLNYAGHAFGTLIDSGDAYLYPVDEIFVDGNLYSQVSFRSPMINTGAGTVTVSNNVTYNAQWVGMQVESRPVPAQFIDIMNNLYWRGPDTMDTGSWPTNEVSTWPAQPDLWPSAWNANRRPVSAYSGPAGTHTHVYYVGNYDYANNHDYAYGNHEGRPVKLEYERYLDVMSYSDIVATSRQTSVAVTLMTPVQLETHVQLDVGCTPRDRDAVDALAVSQAFNRTGGYINHVSDLAVAPYPTGTATRALTSIAGYPAGHELTDSNGNGLTDLEEWIYGL